MCDNAWGIGVDLFRDAYAAWKGSSQHGPDEAIPLGAPVYWTHILIGGTPTRELGHAAIYAGDGWIWSIDIKRSHPGRVDLVPLDLVRTKWGGQFLGWTDDLEGVPLPLGDVIPSTEIPVGAWGIDGAGMAGTTNYLPVAQAGYRFMSMYLGGRYGVHRNNVEAAWAVGLPVVLNWERDANYWTKGYVAGVEAARIAVEVDAPALGWEGQGPIIFSFADSNVSDVGLADETHRGMVDGMQGRGRVGGAYGPPVYLRHLVQQPWWPQAWPLWQWAGAGGVEWWTTIKQEFNHTHNNTAVGFAVDENYTVQPVTAWTGDGLNPEEEDLTPDEHQLLQSIFDVLTTPGRTGPNTQSMEWATSLIYHWTTDKAAPEIAAATWGLMVDNLTDLKKLVVDIHEDLGRDFDKIIALLNALPSGPGGLTRQDVVDAVKVALREGTD